MISQENLQHLIDLIDVKEEYEKNSGITETLTANESKSLQKLREQINKLNISLDNSLKEFQLPSVNSNSNRWEYSKFIYFILLNLVEHEANEIIAPKQQQKFSFSLRKAIDYSLPSKWVLNQTEEIQQKCIFNILILNKLMKSKFFNFSVLRREKTLIYGDYLCALIYLTTFGDRTTISQFQSMLIKTTNDLSQSKLFEILFLLKGRTELPNEIQKQLHIQLMKSLYRSGCFLALCEALLCENNEIDADEQIKKSRWHGCNVISQIIGRKGYKKEFYSMVINEIISHINQFIKNSTKENHQLFYIDAAVECLNKLFSLELNFIRTHIHRRIFENFDRLSTPTDYLTGSIILDENEVVAAVKLLNIVMCTIGPSHLTLPSEMITPYLPLLIRICGEFNAHEKIKLRNDIQAVIVKCLNNRETNDLNKIIDEILFDEYSVNSKLLDSRIRFYCDDTITASFKMYSELDSEFDKDISFMYQTAYYLVNVLKNSNHNVLIYKIFIHVLQLKVESKETEQSSAELLSDSDELIFAIKNKYKQKLTIVYFLQELIHFDGFHRQFNENPHDICDVVNTILIKLIEKYKNDNNHSNEENMHLILTLTENLLQTIQNQKYTNQLKQTLVRLKKELPPHSNISWKLNYILNSDNINVDSDYVKAKKILSEDNSEPYLKAHGIMTIYKLIESKHADALLNKYEILALIMKTLKSEDSYVFLNCIKLLSALMYIMEQEVLDTLIAEYHYDFEADSVDVDFKLKIGETIVKVVSGLGEMSFKYKDELINCFLRGCYHKNDEFRTSNISNLGNILKILSYQIHSNFQEISLIIDQTIKCDTYLPARRAAAFLITEILNGSDNLEELQEYLTPIYRQLKDVLDNESDLQMQIHAKNGLLVLREKVRNLLKGPQNIEKEIKILGVQSENEIRFK